MKNLTTLSFVILLIGSSLMVRAGEAKSLVKILEVQSEECIKGFRVSKDSNDQRKIDRVVTIKSVGRLDQKGQLVSLFDRTSGRIKVSGASECPDLHSFFSPDGKHFIEQITCGPECALTRVVDMETAKAQIPQESSYPTAATSNSFVTLNVFTSETRFFEYSGKEIGNSPSMYRVLSHSNGYIGYGNGSNLYFMDSFGKVLNSKNHHSMGIIFGVDKETGVTAVIEPKPLEFGSTSKRSRVSVYDKLGALKQQYILPFIGYNCGVGVAPGGQYFAVTSGEGWLRLFNVSRNKELWLREYEYGGHFTDTTVPIPISADGKYSIVYGRHPGVDKGTYALLIFDKAGDLVATLEPPVSKSMILTYHVSFLANEPSFVTFSGNELVVYTIK